MSSVRELEPNPAFGDFVVDRSDERVIGPNGPVKLGNKAYRVLLALIEQEGRLLTKDALFSTVWDGTIVSESALTSAIKELRRALGDESRTPRYIESVYGRGYRFIAPVTRATAETPAATAAAKPATVPARPAEGKPPIVLVSAFRDEAVRERYPHCARELREEVLSGLARFREIQLLADQQAEGATAQAAADGRGYQLSATLMPDGDHVKVIARTKRLNDGRILWAETMALSATGTAAGVERIVRRIVGAALPAVDEDLLLGLPQAANDFYDRYLIAKRQSLTASSFSEAKAAAEALEALIAERPDFGLAYPPLVRLYNIDFGYTGLGSSGPAERARALELAKAGLAADRGNVHAYTVLGFCHLWHAEPELAHRCFDQAMTLNPYNSVRLQECATGAMYLGDLAAAGELMERAAELNPLTDDAFCEDLGRLRLIEGKFEAARTALQAILSGSIKSELFLALCELELEIPNGRARFAAWRERVRSAWRGPNAPDDDAIAAWIRYHHPFIGDRGALFFAAVDRALGTGPEERPRTRAPARE